MHKRLMAKLSFANVISMIALFVALSGAAYAGGLVTGKSIVNGTITGKDIEKNSITGAQIKEDKLHGVDSCEPETPVDYRDICFGSPQPAATWANALTACQSVALRLPSTGEAMQVTGAAQHRNNAYIWTSDYAGGTPTSAIAVRSTPFPQYAAKDITEKYQFRCVSIGGNYPQ